MIKCDKVRRVPCYWAERRTFCDCRLLEVKHEKLWRKLAYPVQVERKSGPLVIRTCWITSLDKKIGKHGDVVLHD